MNRTTLDDVARQAGVHRTTVSRALRNDPSIPAETRKRLQALATETGYRPNPLVQALMAGRRNSGTTGSTATLAYLHTYKKMEKTWYHEQVEAGVRARADELGFSIDEVYLPDAELRKGQLTRMLHSRGIRGVVVSPFSALGYEPDVEWDQFASVAIGLALPNPSIHRVSHDYFHGMLTALDGLRRAGYQRIGLCIMRQSHIRVHRSWTAAYREWQTDFAASEQLETLLLGDDAAKCYPLWLKQNRPDAVLTCARYFLKSIHDELGSSKPLPVVATLCVQSCDTDAPGLNQHVESIGSASVEWVAGQLYRNEIGLPDVPRMLLMEGSWIDGAPRVGIDESFSKTSLSRGRRRAAAARSAA